MVAVVTQFVPVTGNMSSDMWVERKIFSDDKEGAFALFGRKDI